MGLLRKAAAAGGPRDADASHALEAPSEAVPVSPPPPAGLLKKIITAKSEEKPAPTGSERGLGIELASPERDSPSPAADAGPPAPVEPPVSIPEPPKRVGRASEEVSGEIIAAITALPQGVEIPSQLFSLLLSRLEIEKGALLLYDPLRLVYAPWASHGFDQTTLHRMRIPLGANASFNALANGSPVSLTEPPSLAHYQAYFSAREFSSLSRLLMTPFIAEAKLIGVLIVTDLQAPFEGDTDLLACLAQVAKAGSQLLQKARQDKLNRAGAQGLRAGTSPEEDAARYLSAFSAASVRILFCSLSLEAYAKKIIAAHAHLDPFRLYEDLRYFLGAFVSDLGTAIPVRQGVYIVALQGFDATDLDLFLHQLSIFLRGLFGGNGKSEADTRPVILTTRSWPEDGTDVQELVEFLSA
jgi:hypothetical protein